MPDFSLRDQKGQSRTLWSLMGPKGLMLVFFRSADWWSATIKRFGTLNTTVPDTNQQSYGIPFPGTFMVNTRGVVTSRFFEQAYQERSTVGSIMFRSSNTGAVQATTLSSPELELTSFATDSTVAPGSHDANAACHRV